MKYSKKFVLLIIVLITIFLFDFFEIRPLIKQMYLENDVKNFKEGSIIYRIIIITCIILLFFFVQLKRLGITQTPGILIYAVFLWFSLFLATKNIPDNILLYINSKTEKVKITKTYTVISNIDPKVFWLDEKSASIHSENELRIIDNMRTSKKLKSIYTYNNRDTIKVNFKKGLIKVNYLN